MTALLLVAHGSRREASNEEVRQIASRLRTQATAEFSQIESAFLELAEPSIPDAITGCIEAGAQEVVILPYFLSAGRHVSKDIPAIMAASQRQHPTVRIRLAPYLGTADELIPALISLAKK